LVGRVRVWDYLWKQFGA